jgi:hypothetical protein
MERATPPFTPETLSVDVDVRFGVSVHESTIRWWLDDVEKYPHNADKRTALCAALGDAAENLFAALGRGRSARRSNSFNPEAWQARLDVPVDRWFTVIGSAVHRLDLAFPDGLFLLDYHPDLPCLLQEKAARGCAVRVLVSDPESPRASEEVAKAGPDARLRIERTLAQLACLSDSSTLQVRLHRESWDSGVLRADDHMIVSVMAMGQDTKLGPTIAVTRLSADRMFAFHERQVEALYESSRVRLPVLVSDVMRPTA